MQTTYTLPYWVNWRTFRERFRKTDWQGAGTIDDPWIVAPSEDVWEWFIHETPRRRKPQSVSLMFEYCRGATGIISIVTITVEPAATVEPLPTLS